MCVCVCVCCVTWVICVNPKSCCARLNPLVVRDRWNTQQNYQRSRFITNILSCFVCERMSSCFRWRTCEDDDDDVRCCEAAEGEY